VQRNNFVQANGWPWSLDGRKVIAEQLGTSAVSPTFDGGFIAAYFETTDAMLTELIRGWRDGALACVELPVSLAELGGPLVLDRRRDRDDRGVPRRLSTRHASRHAHPLDQPGFRIAQIEWSSAWS
jgi:hypothetical protein